MPAALSFGMVTPLSRGACGEGVQFRALPPSDRDPLGFSHVDNPLQTREVPSLRHPDFFYWAAVRSQGLREGVYPVDPELLHSPSNALAMVSRKLCPCKGFRQPPFAKEDRFYDNYHRATQTYQRLTQ